jgi:hypothetical protein
LRALLLAVDAAIRRGDLRRVPMLIGEALSCLDPDALDPDG